MSARSMTVGPSPLRSRPTTPVFPIPVRHLIAGSAKTVCRDAAVRVSCIDNSG